MKPSPIEDVVKGVIKTWGKEKPRFTQEEITKLWVRAAGKKFAEHSKPVSFKSSRLIVEVDSSGWLYELTLEKNSILKKLRGSFKGKALQEIQFRIGEL